VLLLTTTGNSNGLEGDGKGVVGSSKCGSVGMIGEEMFGVVGESMVVYPRSLERPFIFKIMDSRLCGRAVSWGFSE
jgi:hypothetical protein